jgi:hypothetical protein
MQLFYDSSTYCNLIFFPITSIPYVLGLSLQEEHFFLFYAKTPISVKSLLQYIGRLNIKIKENTENMFYFFSKKSNNTRN